MAKGTTIKEAIAQWEGRTGKEAVEAEDIGLQFMMPPIDKMDGTLATLVKCRKLSLSTNAIEKVASLSALTNLRILSLARNNIKSLAGIEVLGENLEQLWVSYNVIDRLKGVEALKRLEVFYVGCNMIKDFTEVNKLSNLPHLKDFVMAGNPCVDSMDNELYRKDICRKLQALKVLDGEPIVRDM